MSSFLSLTVLLIIFPFIQSTGIVWFRISSSHGTSARIEVIDKSNTSAYGFSFDIQLQPNVQKELVLPMPSSPPNSPIPIFDYSIQLLDPMSPIGDASGHRLPLLANYPWINGTVSHRDITISTSVRFECLPQFYGPKCQFFCPFGNNCEIIDCREGKCEEKPAQAINSAHVHPRVVPVRPQKSMIIFYIVFLVFVMVFLLISICIIRRSSVPKREISEPEILEDTYVPFSFHPHFIV